MIIYVEGELVRRLCIWGWTDQGYLSNSIRGLYIIDGMSAMDDMHAFKVRKYGSLDTRGGFYMYFYRR